MLFVEQQARGVAGEQRVGAVCGEDALQKAPPVGVKRVVIEQTELVVGLADGGEEGLRAVVVDVEAALYAAGGEARQQGVKHGEERRGVKLAHVAVAHGVGEVGQRGEAIGEVVLRRGEVGDVAGEGGDERGQVGGQDLRQQCGEFGEAACLLQALADVAVRGGGEGVAVGRALGKGDVAFRLVAVAPGFFEGAFAARGQHFGVGDAEQAHAVEVDAAL